LPRDSIFHLNGAKYVEMQPQVVRDRDQQRGVLSKSDVVLGGRRAEYRITDRQPQFYSYFAPTEALLVKLKPGEKKNDRNLKMGTRRLSSVRGSSRVGIRSEDRIAVKSERRGEWLLPDLALQPAPVG
jgi:hypothetical protein